MAANEGSLREIDRVVGLVREKIAEIETAHTQEQMRRAWEGFVEDFQKAINKICNVAIRDDAARPWGHRLSNASNGSDPGLFFLRRARADSYHGIEPFADFGKAGVSIAGHLRLDGSGTIQLSNVIFETSEGLHRVENATVSLQNETTVNRSGSPVPVKPVPAQVRLRPVSEQEKKSQKTLAVPSSLDGKPLEVGNPLALARAATELLERKAAELRRLLSD